MAAVASFSLTPSQLVEADHAGQSSRGPLAPDSARWIIDIPVVCLFALGVGTLLFATVSRGLLEQPINRFRGAKPRRLMSTDPIYA